MLVHEPGCILHLQPKIRMQPIGPRLRLQAHQGREQYLRGGLRGLLERERAATGLRVRDLDFRGLAEGEARPLAREAERDLERAGSEAGLDLAGDEPGTGVLAAPSLCRAGVG